MKDRVVKKVDGWKWEIKNRHFPAQRGEAEHGSAVLSVVLSSLLKRFLLVKVFFTLVAGRGGHGSLDVVVEVEGLGLFPGEALASEMTEACCG